MDSGSSQLDTWTDIKEEPPGHVKKTKGTPRTICSLEPIPGGTSTPTRTQKKSGTTPHIQRDARQKQYLEDEKSQRNYPDPHMRYHAPEPADGALPAEQMGTSPSIPTGRLKLPGSAMEIKGPCGPANMSSVEGNPRDKKRTTRLYPDE